MKTLLKFALSTLALCAFAYGVYIAFAHNADQIPFDYAIKQILASGVVAFASCIVCKALDDHD